jgi:hypothetical protein
MLTKKTLAAVVLTCGCCAASPILPAESAAVRAAGPAAPSEIAGSPTAGAKIHDAVVVRPVTFTASLVSGAVFIASLPLIPLDSGTDVTTARRALVDYPFGDTFRRPLGDFRGPSGAHRPTKRD